MVYGIGFANFCVYFPMTRMIESPFHDWIFSDKNGSTTNQDTEEPSESTSTSTSTTDFAEPVATSFPVVHQWTVQRGTREGDFGRAMQVGTGRP